MLREAAGGALAAVAGRVLRPLASIETPSLPLTSTVLLDWLGGRPTHAGPAVTETSAHAMSAVWRAVNLLAGTGASLPLHAYHRQGSARVAVPDGPVVDLLDDPHVDMTPFELWELVYGTVLTWGNCALWKRRGPLGRIYALEWIDPSTVRYGRADDGTKVYEINSVGYSDDKVLHIPGYGYDGCSGVSPIRMAREGISLALAAEQYGAKLFGSGSLATGILQVESRLTTEQATEIKAAWKAAGSGLDSAHDIRVVGSGAKWQQLTIPPEDAQFIESRRFAVEEVARWFGMPPHMLGETAKSTSWGSGIEEQNLAFVIYTLRPWLTRFEQRLTKMLRAEGELMSPEPVYARYSVEGLLRGNSAARAAFYTSMWQLGVLSTNDIRALEELPPVDGGDVRYRPLNMGVLGEQDPPDAPLDTPVTPDAPADPQAPEDPQDPPSDQQEDASA